MAAPLNSLQLVEIHGVTFNAYRGKNGKKRVSIQVGAHFFYDVKWVALFEARSA